MLPQAATAFGCLPLSAQQVYLNKPLGVKFARGTDGGAYVTRR